MMVLFGGERILMFWHCTTMSQTVRQTDGRTKVLWYQYCVCVCYEAEYTMTKDQKLIYIHVNRKKQKQNSESFKHISRENNSVIYNMQPFRWQQI